MKFRIRKSFDRGHVDHDWLESRHSFSFGEYHDPAHMGFRTLRVINEDKVAAGSGFPMHGHRDMEIFSYVLQGELEHRDSMGNHRRLGPGDIQLMSAGSGVLHSECNPSEQMPVHFLQIWIRPFKSGLLPAYSDAEPGGDGPEGKCLLISPDGRDGSALIRQDAEVWRLRLREGGRGEHELREGRGAWIQVVKGAVDVNGHELVVGDGISTEEPGRIVVSALKDTELLLFDLV